MSQDPGAEVEEDEQVTLTIVCSGPPYCDLRGDKAQRAQEGGCIWCARIYDEPDGRQFVEQPGTA